MRAMRNAGGYVLLEALVALLVFSLGLLGMIGFQAAATKLSSDSRFRTEAAMLADELITKMSVADLTTVASEYATGGAKFNVWLRERVKSGSGLPNPEATVTISPATTTTTLLASVRIEWEQPDTSDGARSGGMALARRGVYVTQALLF